MKHVFTRYLAPEPGAAGGGGDPGGLLAAQAARDEAARLAAQGSATAADARTYLTNYVADPKGLDTMPEPDLLKFHQRVRDFNDKAVTDAVTKAAGKLDKRPEFVPEQFYDEKGKTINLEAAFKSLSDTRQELKKLKGDPKAGTVPKDANGYQYTPPKDLPAHIASDPNDDSIKLLRNIAFKAQLTQDQFNTLTEDYLRGSAELLPAPPDEKAELAKLGANGPKLVETVVGWGKGMVASGLLSKDEFEEVFVMGSSAAGVRALNKIREAMGGQPIPSTSAGGEALPSITEAYALVGTEKYKKDPVERARVTKIFEQLFGAGSSPTGSSPPIPA